MLEGFSRRLPGFAQNVLGHGYLAVGTFFVLSGFVLALSYSRVQWDRNSLIRYGVARFARVYPIYALSLVLVLPFMIEDLFRPGKLPIDGAGKAMLVANYGLVLQGWTGKLPVHWNTPAWSLSCEVFFYLCFPIAVLLLARCGRFGTLTAGTLALAAPLVHRWAEVPALWKPVIHLADFAGGIVAARVFVMLAQRLNGRGYWLYGPALAAVAVVSGSSLAGTDLNSLLRPANMALLAGLGLGGGLPVRAFTARLTVFLGKASYSMYILHIPLLWWYKRYLFLPAGPLAAGLFFAGVVAASAATYAFLEEPANKRIRAWAAARS